MRNLKIGVEKPVRKVSINLLYYAKSAAFSIIIIIDVLSCVANNLFKLLTSHVKLYC